MLRFALRRLVGGIPLIVLISLMVFSLVLMLPGAPAITIAGDSASPETIERIREQLGENDPILERYFDWAGPAVRGDFGTSLFSDQEVTEAIRQRAPATISLTIMALVIALMISVPAGLVAGLNPGTGAVFLGGRLRFPAVPVPALAVARRRRVGDQLLFRFGRGASDSGPCQRIRLVHQRLDPGSAG